MWSTSANISEPRKCAGKDTSYVVKPVMTNTICHLEASNKIGRLFQLPFDSPVPACLRGLLIQADHSWLVFIITSMIVSLFYSILKFSWQ